MGCSSYAAPWFELNRSHRLLTLLLLRRDSRNRRREGHRARCIDAVAPKIKALEPRGALAADTSSQRPGKSLSAGGIDLVVPQVEGEEEGSLEREGEDLDGREVQLARLQLEAGQIVAPRERVAERCDRLDRAVELIEILGGLLITALGRQLTAAQVDPRARAVGRQELSAAGAYNDGWAQRRSNSTLA